MSRQGMIPVALTALVLALALSVAAAGGGAEARCARPGARGAPQREGHDVQAALGGTKDHSLQTSLDKCTFIKKNPKDAFAAIFALIPVVLIEVVDDYGPELRALRASIGAMHPDSSLFAEWLTGEGNDLSLILEFDNHGKKIDLCRAATVLLDKKTTAADIQRVLGIDPALLAKIFSSPVSSKLEKLNPKMRAFLIAAGVSRKNAATLTSSD